MLYPLGWQNGTHKGQAQAVQIRWTHGEKDLVKKKGRYMHPHYKINGQEGVTRVHIRHVYNHSDALTCLNFGHGPHQLTVGFIWWLGWGTRATLAFGCTWSPWIKSLMWSNKRPFIMQTKECGCVWYSCLGSDAPITVAWQLKVYLPSARSWYPPKTIANSMYMCVYTYPLDIIPCNIHNLYCRKKWGLLRKRCQSYWNWEKSSYQMSHLRTYSRKSE